MKKCKTCGKNAESEYCFQHKPRKSMNKGIYHQMRSRPVTDFKKMKEDLDKIIMKEMFLLIWKKRRHYSEISGEYLGSEALSIYFHHILPKEKYPEACLDEENIILLSLDEHTNVESNIYRYEAINNKRIYLKKKYNLL